MLVKKKSQCRICKFLFLSLADAGDRVMDINCPLKQEGGEAPQAQGDGAGKYLYGR